MEDKNEIKNSNDKKFLGQTPYQNVMTVLGMVILLVMILGFCTSTANKPKDTWDYRNKHDMESYLKWSERQNGR